MFADTRSSIETICPSIECALAPRDEQHADALAVADQRQRRRRADLAGLGALAPGQRTRIVQEIVADAYLPVAKGLPADPGTLGRAGHDRNVDAAQPRNIIAEAGGEAQEIGLRLQQEDRRRPESRRPKTRLRTPSRTALRVIWRTESLRWSHSTPRMCARYRSSPSPSSLRAALAAPRGFYACRRPKCSLLATAKLRFRVNGRPTNSGFAPKNYGPFHDLSAIHARRRAAANAASRILQDEIPSRRAPCRCMANRIFPRLPCRRRFETMPAAATSKTRRSARASKVRKSHADRPGRPSHAHRRGAAQGRRRVGGGSRCGRGRLRQRQSRRP